MILQKKLSFLQQPDPLFNEDGIRLAAIGINELVKIPDPLCELILLYLLICISKFSKILFILFISLRFKLILIEPPLFFFLFKDLFIPWLTKALLAATPKEGINFLAKDAAYGNID